ncbi:Anti-sigma regulatory factor (Ser/Thr protein kinase) [Actinacidiphila alni]|uniref:Anti-sigma regulatory factor (Ser/Thr protein kinase) n=1 Tax=Actinacidiphila alni TaxID=380248 RepID=A0A1I2LDN2_9ACTN|nr:ATP-binding protein [Actinacidiphila alni]SFF77123.1 Anti-sigma regulatory factor (Ser/Thr protein kinase) [Actinacidiphila alni]
MRISGTYTGGSGSIAAARNLVTAFMCRADADGFAPAQRLLGDARLVVSELVTNAVKHTPGPCGIVMELVGDAVRITVWDTSPLRPAAPAPDQVSAGHHGMTIISTLCGPVHVTRRGVGKQVTTTLRADRLPS